MEGVAPDCVDQQYRCPAGFVDLDSCSQDACARRTESCCSPTGHASFPDCAADGTIGECPAGFEEKSPCLPEGVTSCAELIDGAACSSAELQCFTGRCNRNCYCKGDASGALSWVCTELLC